MPQLDLVNDVDPIRAAALLALGGAIAAVMIYVLDRLIAKATVGAGKAA